MKRPAMRNILSSLGAFWSCDRKILPIKVPFPTNFAYPSAQEPWNIHLTVSSLCSEIGNFLADFNRYRPYLPIAWLEGSETGQNVSHRSSLHFGRFRMLKFKFLLGELPLSDQILWPVCDKRCTFLHFQDLTPIYIKLKINDRKNFDPCAGEGGLWHNHQFPSRKLQKIISHFFTQPHFP